MNEPLAALDHRAVSWTNVVAARYHVAQSLRYVYDSPIMDLRHQLIITPRVRHLDQQRVDSRIWSNGLGNLPLMHDEFGNDVATLRVPRVEHEIEFSLDATILRDSRVPLPRVEAVELHDPRWVGGRRLTRPDEAITDAANDLRARYPNQRELCEAIMLYVNGHMTYTKSVTDVFTTASVAFAQRQGVCQDFAHVAISLARAAGISARYVSGHLLGEGATHAWVEFLISDKHGIPAVLSLDPTYKDHTDYRYVVVAIGRDYDDVPPTSGAFRGNGCGVLHGKQLVRLTDVTYAA